MLLAAAVYGAMLALFRRPGPLVLPRALVPAFAVVAGHFGVRFAFLPDPTYGQAKFSEWPEFLFAAAVALQFVRWFELLTKRLGGPSLTGLDGGPDSAAAGGERDR